MIQLRIVYRNFGCIIVRGGGAAGAEAMIHLRMVYHNFCCIIVGGGGGGGRSGITLLFPS